VGVNEILAFRLDDYASHESRLCLPENELADSVDFTIGPENELLLIAESMVDNDELGRSAACPAADTVVTHARGTLMPRTKKHQPGPRSQSQPPPASANGASGEVLTLAEAAAYLRLTESDVIGLVRSQGLPGRCIASEWRFLKAAITHWLATAPSGWEDRKAAILELAGKYKEDPDLEQIVEDAYRRRGRKITEGHSSRNLTS
jgi:hypothetical protein